MLYTTLNTPVFDRVMTPGVAGQERQSYALAADLRCLLLFRLERVIPRGAQVTEAKLIVPVLGPAGQAGSLGVSNILRPWDPASVGWDVPWSVPGGAEGVDFSTVRAVSVVAPGAGEVLAVKLDVTGEVGRWVRGRASNVGWMLHGDVRIGGRRNAMNAATPRVAVKYIGGASAAPGAGLGGL